MEKNLPDTVNKKSIFYKIKKFFAKMFKGKNAYTNEPQLENVKENEETSINTPKNNFIEEVRDIENDETRLLKLQKQFDNGEIDKSQLSEEQIDKLIELYKEQITNLEESNKNRIEKIKNHKDGESILKSLNNVETELLKLQEQYDNRQIEFKDLPQEKIDSLINLYKEQINKLSESNKEREEKLLAYRNKMQNA